MRIRYENTLDDVVAFYNHKYLHSKLYRNQIVIYRWAVPILLVLAVLIAAEGGRGFRLAGLTMFLIAFVILLPVFLRRITEGVARQIFQNGVERGIFGPHELEVTENGLLEKSDAGEQCTRWHAIEQIISDGDHTFIYLTPVTAHVVPHRTVTDGDVPDFIASVQKKMAAAGASSRSLGHTGFASRNDLQ